MNATRSNGIVIGLVEDLGDPEGLGRVRVRYPYLDNQLSDWARLATLMAGDGRGSFFRPEPDDEVLVAFEQGDPRRPYVLGGLWSKATPPPEDTGSAEQNNLRLIKSRSGHLLIFDDTDGQEKIDIIDKDGLRRITIDSANGKIEVISSQGDVVVKAPAGEVKIEALNVTIEAQTSLNLRCNGATTISGSTVAIN